MKKTLLPCLPEGVPCEIARWIGQAQVYDSSCSPEARVYFVNKDEGYYLKTSAKGSLKREAEMTAYFHTKRLGTEVLAYVSEESDWLLTARVRGEDCTHARYLSDPKRLCDTLARDCAEFQRHGYQIGSVTPVDMFPRTGHVESVVCLTRR